MAESRPSRRFHELTLSGSPTAAKAALAVGFLSLAGGLLRARQAQAQTYEPSIYAATPIEFWIAVAVAMTVSLAVAVSGYRSRLGTIALVLGGSGMLAVVSLPLLRGYHFYGFADSLAHLGWARGMSAGTMGPFDLVYPSSHLFSAALDVTLGIGSRRALMLAVSIFVVAYFAFVALTVRALIPEPGASIAGAFTAFLLLTVLNVGPKLMFFPFVLGVLFTPLFVYLLVGTVSRPARSVVSGLPVTAFDVLVLGTGVVFVGLHPQVFADVLLLLGAIVAIQFVADRTDWRGAVSDHRPVVVHFVVLSVLFLLWNASHDTAARTLTSIVTALTGSADAGAVVQQRSGSLSSIGVGLPEMFGKLFLVHTLVMAVVAWLVVTSLVGDSEGRRRDVNAWVRYLVPAGALVAANAALHFVGEVSTYTFRHLGFGMMLVTILGGAGLYLLLTGRSTDGTDGRSVRPTATVAVTAVGVAVLALSVAVVFPSPYVYLPNHHVTETEMAGYDAAFAHRADGVGFAGVRGGAKRYSEAMPDVSNLDGESVYGRTIESGLDEQFSSDTYFAVTRSDRRREIRTYRELRVTRSDFRRIHATDGASRVQSNGALTVYHVPADA